MASNPTGSDDPAEVNNVQPQGQDVQGQPGGQGDAPAAEGAQPTSPAEALQQARAELEEMRDRYLRTRAEMENYKRRIERSYADLARNYKKDLFLKILHVMDNLERALAYQDSGRADASSLAEGLRLTHAELTRLLEQEGLQRIAAEGEPFDPRKHEAIQVAHDRTLGEGQILAEVRRGYTYQDDVLRPSQVVVNKPEEPAAREVPRDGQ